jgi:hypothetical protein
MLHRSESREKIEKLVFVEVFYVDEIKHYSFIGEGNPLEIATTGLRAMGIKPEADPLCTGLGIGHLDLNLN